MKKINKIVAGVMIALFGYVIWNCGYTQGYINKEIPPSNEINSKTIVFADEEKPLHSIGYYEATAYCPCVKCCGKTDGITASGTQATAGRTIAADTSILPFGTEVYFNGNKYTVEDRGGAINGKKIDVYFDTHQEAVNFGRQWIELFVEG